MIRNGLSHRLAFLLAAGLLCGAAPVPLRDLGPASIGKLGAALVPQGGDAQRPGVSNSSASTRWRYAAPALASSKGAGARRVAGDSDTLTVGDCYRAGAVSCDHEAAPAFDSPPPCSPDWRVSQACLDRADPRYQQHGRPPVACRSQVIAPVKERGRCRWFGQDLDEQGVPTGKGSRARVKDGGVWCWPSAAGKQGGTWCVLPEGVGQTVARCERWRFGRPCAGNDRQCRQWPGVIAHREQRRPVCH